METTHEMLRMVRKEFSQSKTIMRGWHQARIMNIREKGQDLEEKLFFGLQNPRMTRRNTTKLLRHSGRIKRGKIEPKMKMI